MTYRAAIRWTLRGINQSPTIQYMLLDGAFDYVIYPKQCLVTDLKQNLTEIMEDIERHSCTNPLVVHYKSINYAYGRHRRDSARFHLLIKKTLAKRNLLTPNSRLAYELKKESLKQFKRALYFLDVECKSKGNAYITYLWAIALKATRSRVKLVIKQIWKARSSIKRMNAVHERHFEEFYDHFI